MVYSKTSIKTGDVEARKSIAEEIETEKNALAKTKFAMNANAKDLAQYCISKDQNVKASMIWFRKLRCRRPMFNKNEPLEAVADKVENDIDSIPTDVLKSNTQTIPTRERRVKGVKQKLGKNDLLL